MSTSTTTARKNAGRGIGRTRIDYRRKRVPKSELTLDWAKVNVELTERKKKILELLRIHRLMTIDQLEYLHPDFGHQSQSKLLLRRDINKLHEVYLVDKAIKKPVIQWDGSVKKTIVIAMGQLGSQYVGWPTHYDRIRYVDGKPILPATAHHILRIHDMEIQTRELLKQLDIEIKAWVFESKKVIKHENGLNPDVFCMLFDRQTEKFYTLFIEYDTGKDDFRRRRKFPKLSKKIERYQEIKNWPSWYKKQISQVSETKFPFIFFVTEDEKRFPVIPQLFEEKGLDHVACMQQDYLSALKKFIEQQRSSV
jgi:hypothetical protein